MDGSDDRIVDVAALIDRARFSPFQIFVVTLCGLTAMVDGFDTQAIGFVAPVIAAQWGIKVSTFGPVFSAGLFGLTLGTLAFGLAADRFGRKWMLILCTAIFGVFALATGFVTSFEQLMLLRFLTGLGLGGVSPNIVTITSEYAPARLRATLIGVMFSGFPLGAVAGGLLSAQLISAVGWQGVFWIGGVLPLALTLVLALCLPESIRYMVARRRQFARIAEVLQRIDPAFVCTTETIFILPEQRGHGGIPVIQLFRNHLAIRTSLLWVVFFMNLLVIYFFSNWLPTILRQGGIPIGRAIVATTLLYVGGMAGGVLLARFIDRLGPYGVLAASYLGAAVSIACLGTIATDPTAIFLFVFLIGFSVIGAQISINALASATYPTMIRATGVGWALGVGRIGSIVGPLLGGLLIGANLPISTLFLVIAGPALLAAILVFVLKFVRSAEITGDSYALKLP